MGSTVKGLKANISFRLLSPITYISVRVVISSIRPVVLIHVLYVLPPGNLNVITLRSGP